MTNLTKKTCALFGCNKPVLNWRLSCCSPTHQKSYAAKKRHGTENQPNQTKEEFLDYVNNYVRAKQAMMKNSMPKWANLDKMKLIYDEASELTEKTGIKHGFTKIFLSFDMHV
jgi:hypothetical protein